jgi:hypothetical protein
MGGLATLPLGHLDAPTRERERAERKEEQRENEMAAATGFHPSRQSVPIGGLG